MNFLEETYRPGREKDRQRERGKSKRRHWCIVSNNMWVWIERRQVGFYTIRHAAAERKKKPVPKHKHPKVSFLYHLG